MVGVEKVLEVIKHRSLHYLVCDVGCTEKTWHLLFDEIAEEWLQLLSSNVIPVFRACFVVKRLVFDLEEVFHDSETSTGDKEWVFRIHLCLLPSAGLVWRQTNRLFDSICGTSGYSRCWFGVLYLIAALGNFTNNRRPRFKECLVITIMNGELFWFQGIWIFLKRFEFAYLWQLV